VRSLGRPLCLLGGDPQTPAGSGAGRPSSCCVAIVLLSLGLRPSLLAEFARLGGCSVFPRLLRVWALGGRTVVASPSSCCVWACGSLLVVERLDGVGVVYILVGLVRLVLFIWTVALLAGLQVAMYSSWPAV
jgi:hypothetical protein